MVVHVERDEVERPLVAQLEAMGWTHVPGVELDTLDAAVPLLVDQRGPALRRINLRGGNGQSWMGEDDIRRAVSELASLTGGLGLDEALAFVEARVEEMCRRYGDVIRLGLSGVTGHH